MPKHQRPPILNLGTETGDIKPLAFALLLSVMSFPTDQKKRRAFMAHARRAYQAGHSIESLPGMSEAFKDGCVVGDCLITLLQLNEHEPSATLNLSWQYVRAALLHNAGRRDLKGLPRMENANVGLAIDILAGEFGGISRPKLIAKFKAFRPVAHIWAAYILVYYRDWPDLFPESEQSLPRFVALTEAIRDWVASIRMRNLKPQELLPSSTTWRIQVPLEVRESLTIEIPPVSEFARNAVTGSLE